MNQNEIVLLMATVVFTSKSGDLWKSRRVKLEFTGNSSSMPFLLFSAVSTGLEGAVTRETKTDNEQRDWSLRGHGVQAIPYAPSKISIKIPVKKNKKLFEEKHRSKRSIWHRRFVPIGSDFPDALEKYAYVWGSLFSLEWIRGNARLLSTTNLPRPQALVLVLSAGWRPWSSVASAHSSVPNGCARWSAAGPWDAVEDGSTCTAAFLGCTDPANTETDTLYVIEIFGSAGWCFALQSSRDILANVLLNIHTNTHTHTHKIDNIRFFKQSYSMGEKPFFARRLESVVYLRGTIVSGNKF